MTDKYDLTIRVTGVNGTCASGHKVGEQWDYKGKTPGGICMTAFGAIFPIARVLRYGGTCPWQKDPDRIVLGCPDPSNRVFFEMRRARKA